jgi:hypothetical protein
MGFLHVGMKVHDIERATRFYTAVFGIAWEPVREYQLGDITLNGDVAPSRTLVTHGKIAQGFEIEMVQVLEARSPTIWCSTTGRGYRTSPSRSKTWTPLSPRRRSAACFWFPNTGPRHSPKG